jgi:hypothetical protein
VSCLFDDCAACQQQSPRKQLRWSCNRSAIWSKQHVAVAPLPRYVLSALVRKDHGNCKPTRLRPEGSRRTHLCINLSSQRPCSQSHHIISSVTSVECLCKRASWCLAALTGFDLCSWM